MAGRVQEPVTFEDVAVYLSRAEWDAVVEEQRDLYRSVMRDNYELLTSLGYPGPKPDVLYRMERGEEPWVCTPQSPVRWDGPSSSSPGRNGDVSWLEEPPSGWWPGAGGSPVLEERAQTPCHAGGRCTHWRLRTRRLLNKFTCLGGRSKLPAEAAGGGAGPEESQDRARTVFGPGKEGEVEDNVARSRGFSPHPVVEKQNKEADPQEHPRGDPRERSQRSAQECRCALGDGMFLWRNNKLSAADLNEIILKDHCYFTMRQTQLLLCTSCLCFLREHDYCRNREVVVSALQDHEYCHVQRIPYQGRVNQTVRLSGKARAVLRRLARRKSLVRRIVKKAKRIMWRCKSCVSTALEFPQGSSSAGCPEPAVPPAKAKGNPTAGTCGAFCPPAEQGAVPPQPQSKGGSQGVTSEAPHALLVSFEPAAALPPSNAAVELKRDAPRPEVSARREARGTQLAQSHHATQNVEGHALHSNPLSLRDAYKMVMRTVDQMLDSICQNFERGGYAQCKDVWPVVIQIDS